MDFQKRPRIMFDGEGKRVILKALDDAAAPVNLAEKFGEVVEREGIDLTTHAGREKAARLVAGEAASVMPLYGERAAAAERMGGRDRLEAYEALVRKHRLNPDRDAAYAFRLLMEELGVTLADARTVDEALYCALKQAGKAIHCSEQDTRTAMAVVMAERPDLIPDYGGVRARRAAQAEAEKVELSESDSERDAKFEAAVREELVRRNQPDEPQFRGEAARHVARMRPELTPRTYGTGRGFGGN